MTGACYHPAPAIRFFAHGRGSLVCDACGARRRLTETEKANRDAALKAFQRFAEQHDAPVQPAEAEVLLLGDGIGYLGRVADGRKFGIGFRFDNGEPFPRPSPYWPPEVAVPLRATA